MRASTPRGLPQSTPLFWLLIAALVVLLVALPIIGTRLLDLDGRTPAGIARDTLLEEYGLVRVDARGKPLPEDSVAESRSEFSVESGSVTKQVPFLRDGVPVECTVSVPAGPDSVTADCDG